MAKLYFKYGAMGSSKSAQALITQFNYEELGMTVWLIKPSVDDRDGANIIRSRIGLQRPRHHRGRADPPRRQRQLRRHVPQVLGGQDPRAEGSRGQMNRRASRILTVCAAVWLLVIWGHSCMPATQSGAESGALLTVVQRLLPWMTDHVLRKCAHFAEYAVLGALTAAALRTSAHFSWPRALLPGPFAALCDETIQLFVPGRSGRIADVWLDTAGYLTGALLTLLIFRLCRKRPEA